ncbi:2,3-dihydro-2,3-dihydroxybenzoate dehydrogenase [Streptosporangium sp. KLBMP 9127]|nr:2,3-dihydro-2,3-dihydroxybenzoate dehydrogenase [Streptosporangium sp. KLBMP 9127]
MNAIGATGHGRDSGIRGRIAVVSGAAQGIGAAVCAVLAEAGAKIAALDVRGDPLLEVTHSTPGAQAYVTDVRDGIAVRDTIARIEREIGPIDICVNVAGILRTGPVTSMSEEDWRDTFAVNAEGVFHLSRAVARRMASRHRGTIITVASNAAGVPRMGMAAYAASKAAAVMFTRCLGLELAPYGIRCNVVSPGSTDTDMLRKLSGGFGDTDAVINGVPEQYRVGIPLGRIASPLDVADAVAFLASDRARHITMHNLYVDGGATLCA